VKLLTVLINYKTADMTLESLAAFLASMEGESDFGVIVVDNHSEDGSFARIAAEVEKRGWAPRVRVIETPRNGGFAYGVNAGVYSDYARAERPELFYLLNSDAFPARGSVQILVDFLRDHPTVGIAGSYIHGDGGVDDTHVTAFRFPSLLGEVEGGLRLGFVSAALAAKRVSIFPVPSEPTRVDWLAGASMLIRARVFEQIGPFDDRFFLYYEETDFCRRALAAGWTTYYVPASKVMHIGSVSTGMKVPQRRMPSYWFESRAHYFRKHHGRAYLLVTDLLWIAAFASWRLRRFVQRKPDEDRPRLLTDFVVATLRRLSGGARP
jgi:hypothetical protein